MPCWYLLPYVFNVHVLLFGYCQLVTAQQRFERHELPTDHIVVHSSNSNVSIADWVVVISDESRVEFQEKFLHGKVWSGNSQLKFQPLGQMEKFSAHNNVLSIFELPQVNLQTKCEQIQIFLRANRSTDGHSYMEYKANKNVNIIFTSGVTEINAFNGRWAQITAVTWQLSMPGQITIGSNILSGLSRQLHIVSVSSNYSINITIFDAQMQMRYGNITIQITSDYRILIIRSELYMVNLKTIVSPFEISISDHEMIVQCENERAVVQLLPNSSNIVINTNQYSRVVIDRGREAVILGGQEIRPAGNINLLSMQLKVLLKSGNLSSIHASTNHSQITMQTTSTNMASTAAHHAIDIIGGRINLHVFTGNVSMDIVANTHLASLPTMLTPFLTPPNNFQDITMDNFNLDFLIDERNNGSNNLVTVTQTPLTVANSSVSHESSNFRDGVALTKDVTYGNTLEPAFTIPSTLSTIKSTGTISLVFPEQSSTIMLKTGRTTSKPLSSTERTPPSHSENASHTSFITEATKTERIDTSIDTANWLKVDGTTTASIILLNTSTVTSSDMLSIYSSPSFLLTAATSSSPTTVRPAIPLIPLKTLTSSRTSEIIISSIPITSRIPQSFISTSTTNGSGDVTEVMVSEKKYPDEENVQTDFIEFSWDSIADSSIPIIATSTVISTAAHTDAGDLQKVRKTECIEIEPSKNRSAWTPFASLPFEFPPTAHYPSTVSSGKGNFILQDNKAKSEITFDTNEVSKNKEWNKSALNVSSVPMITAVKEIFGKIMQHGSQRNENPRTEFGQQQNFFSSSKFKRALSSFENEEIYELELKIPLDINLTAVELHRELLLALKKFVLFTNLHEERLPINEDAIRIKITNMERNGDYLKVLYSVFINAKVNAVPNCAQNHEFNDADLLLVVVGILILMLFSIGALLVRHKQCYNFAV
ncbi:unnamed protein product [Acanthocheilonema viteae]|uniref:Uncharacterized protein n=1 Tax=Acanthocheilonema viteae TaxID=6277 RepID=A0A498SB24_ACAVI|nr:unnamed protein product [Acanthocheilonema viteae]